MFIQFLSNKDCQKTVSECLGRQVMKLGNYSCDEFNIMVMQINGWPFQFLKLMEVVIFMDTLSHLHNNAVEHLDFLEFLELF